MAAIETEIEHAQRHTLASTTRRFELTRVDRKFLVIALASLFAIRLLAVFWLPFVDPTEARYAEIARKMVETGDWITPQFDYGVPFWGKPPLHTWLSALGMKIFGVGHFGGRIFILATSLAVLFLVIAWVRAQRGTEQALVAITVLASSIMFFGASAFVMTDMAMVLGTTLSMIAFYNCLGRGPSSATWGRLFFVGIAIGLLAKGPVALVLTLIPIVPWLAISGRWRNLGVVPWVSGLLIACVLTLPWYIAAELKTPGFLRYFIIGEHFERFVVPGWQGDLYGSGHEEPKGIIWLFGLATFLPWTLFVLGLIPRAKTLWADRSREGSDEGSDWHMYLLLWSISPLILFTPAANILPAYALPGLPAASIFLVSLWADSWGAPGRKTRIAVAASVGLVGVLFLTLTVLAYFSPNTVSRSFSRDLVAAAQEIDPETQFTYWGRRSYSAEFYTRGTVRFTDQTATFDALADNNLRDAVAIPQKSVEDVSPFLGDDFHRIGDFGERVLFVERNTQ